MFSVETLNALSVSLHYVGLQKQHIIILCAQGFIMGILSGFSGHNIWFHC